MGLSSLKVPFVICLFFVLLTVLILFYRPTPRYSPCPKEAKPQPCNCTVPETTDKDYTIHFNRSRLMFHPVKDWTKTFLYFREESVVKDLYEKTVKHIEKDEVKRIKDFKENISEMDMEMLFPFEKGTFGIIQNYYPDNKLDCLLNILYHSHAAAPFVPVEVWTYKKDVDEISRIVSLLHLNGVTFRYYDDIHDKVLEVFGPVDQAEGRSYQYKLWSMVGTHFEKFVFLDSDAFLLDSPLHFMETLMKTKQPAVLWHDMYGILPTNPIYRSLGVKEIQGQSFESGVVYIDKSMGLKPLCLALFLNHRQKYTYSLLWGDKDTFYFGFEMMGVPYQTVPYHVGYAGHGKSIDDFNGVVFYQFDINGFPGYIHYTSGRYVMRDNFAKGTFPLESVIAFNGRSAFADWGHRTGKGKVSVIPTEGDPETKLIGYEEANLRVQVVLQKYYLIAKTLLNM